MAAAYMYVSMDPYQTVFLVLRQFGIPHSSRFSYAFVLRHLGSNAICDNIKMLANARNAWLKLTMTKYSTMTLIV